MLTHFILIISYILVEYCNYLHSTSIVFYALHFEEIIKHICKDVNRLDASTTQLSMRDLTLLRYLYLREPEIRPPWTLRSLLVSLFGSIVQLLPLLV